jgi:hypothetical protein
METSMLAFATDLHDEGLEVVLGNVQERAGVDGVTMAVAYHDARDVFPHNPVHKVRYLEGGAVFFQLDVSRYEGLQLRPRVAELAQTSDPLGALCAAAGERGMDANAWAVFLHSDRLGFAHPGCATQNAFGDRYLTDLCPSNLEVRAYASALASDVARYGVSMIFAESLHFHGLAHGTTTSATLRNWVRWGSTYSVYASASIASTPHVAPGSTPKGSIAPFAMNSSAAL